MSFRAKRELLVQVAPRYRAARHGQRSVILDEFVAATGYDRKYAIRLLLGPIRPPQPIRRPRVALYGAEVQEALANAWTAANGICGKRLVPFLPELIPALERHGHLSLSDTVRQQVLSLSPATADRLLKPLRQPHGLLYTLKMRLCLLSKPHIVFGMGLSHNLRLSTRFQALQSILAYRPQHREPWLGAWRRPGVRLFPSPAQARPAELGPHQALVHER